MMGSQSSAFKDTASCMLSISYVYFVCRDKGGAFSSSAPYAETRLACFGCRIPAICRDKVGVFVYHAFLCSSPASCMLSISYAETRLACFGCRIPAICRDKVGVFVYHAFLCSSSCHHLELLFNLYMPKALAAQTYNILDRFLRFNISRAVFMTMEHTLGLTTPSESHIPPIAISACKHDLTKWKGDIVVVGVSSSDLDKDENGTFKNTTLRKLDEFLKGILGAVSTEEEFTGKAGQSTVVRLFGFGFKRVGLVGCENSGVSSPAKWKSFGESVAAAAKTAQAKSLAVTLANLEDLDEKSLQVTAHAIATGVSLGSYEDLRFKSEKKNSFLQRLELVGFGNGGQLEYQLKITEKVCAGINFTRDLVNAPANVLTPASLAAEVLGLSGSFEDVLTAQIFDEEKCRELKMGAFLGVTAASTNPPKFIHLQYKPPKGETKIKLAIVGKGLTFDSGGYNLKLAGSSIEIMKNDMAGAAAAFGAAKAIAAIRPLGVEVNFIVAACENMISGSGMRPGDIVTASDGKTIEVNNTDAEGRLVLADSLIYTCKQGVHKIVDLATLTGACIVALGNEIAGMFTPNDELAKELSESCERAGEKLWRMPIEENYWELMKSGIADMINTGPQAGGAITASLFIKQFVDESIPWAHLDVAGPVWNEKKNGATGFAVSTLVEWVLKHSTV